MEASSREALAAVRERLTEQTDSPTGVVDRARERLTGQARGASEDDRLTLADELFSVARLLEHQPTLRRALSDPAARPDDRAGLAQRLLDGKVSEATLELVQAVARERWSRPLDLVEAFETLGTDAALTAAEAGDVLDTVEDELFRFGRIVAGDPDLSRLLSDRSASAKGKVELVDRLLSGKTTPVTELLVRNTLISSGAGHAENAIERLSEAASARRGQSVAHVTAPAALSEEQQERLASILSRIYGRAIGIQLAVDPELLGGLVIRVGDEVIDGSVADRLEDARRRLAG